MLDNLIEALKAGLLGLFGGMANYCYYKERNNKAFRMGAFLTAAILSYFVGTVAGEFLPLSDQRDGLLMLSGFCCYPILGWVEARIDRYLDKKADGS